VKKLLCGIALVGGLVGCESEPGLDELTLSELHFTVDKEHRHLLLELYVDTPGGCEPISSAIQAEVDGMPMRLVDAGGIRGGGPLTSGSDCLNPLFVLEVPEEAAFPPLEGPVTSVKLRDGETEVVAEVEHLCTERRLRLVTPASGVVHPGEQVEVAIEPGTDILRNPYVWWSTTGPREGYALSSYNGLTMSAQRIRFRAPDFAGLGVDSAYLELTGPVGASALVPRVSRCDGFRRCEFKCEDPASYSIVLPIRLEP
jgi:hypothetical protein